MRPFNSPRIAGWIRPILLGLLLSGCAGFQVKNSPNHDKDIPKKDQQFISVPFFPDNTDQCGPSALTSVFTFWGNPIDPLTLREEIYLAHLKGSLPMDLLLAAEKHGFKAHLYSGNIDDLKSELKKGHPLIAFTNRGFDFYPIGHFVVIVGYDEEHRGLTIHSGLKGNRFVSYKRFLRDWNKTERSTLLILPSERDNESPHSIAADFPRANENDLAQFEAALHKKNKYTPGLIALGNLAFEKGDLKKAEGLYRQVLRMDRNHAGANNNLAMVYLARGKDLGKAEKFAQRALKQGGVLQPYVLETLAELYIRQDRIKEARKVLSEADALAQADNTPLCDQLAQTREMLAMSPNQGESP